MLVVVVRALEARIGYWDLMTYFGFILECTKISDYDELSTYLPKN